MKTDWMPNDERFRLWCPMLNRVIHGRKFLVPNYRQAHYENQDKLNNDFEGALIAITSGSLGYTDDVANAQYGNMVAALDCGRPVLFLEKELGEKLIEAPLPKGMVAEDIHWVWRQFRVIMPLGLIEIERAGARHSLTYMDLCLIPDDGLWMPKRFAPELEAFTEKFMPELYYSPRRIRTPDLRVKMGETYLAIVASIDYSEVGFGPTTYAYTAPWTDKKIGEIVAYTGGLNTLMPCDDLDKALLDGMKHLGITILLWLSQKPWRYMPEVLRKERAEGKRLIPELAKAHFVGQEAYKAALIRAKGAHELTGRHLLPHLRKGHWKMVPYGPKHGLRRWQWIDMYMAGQADNE
jgi:hypothetical protein